MRLRTVVPVLAVALAVHVEANRETQAWTHQFTCLESERSRCRLVVEEIVHPFAERAFALKVGETIVFDLVANEKRRCWNWACGAASRYEWPLSNHTRLDGGYDQVIHAAYTHEEMIGAPERLGEHPDYSGWYAPLRVVPHAPSLSERFTCVDVELGTSVCSVAYTTEETLPNSYGLSVEEGQSIVHDRIANTLQECWGESCRPVTELVGGLSPVDSLIVYRTDEYVAVLTYTHVRLLTP